MEKQVVIIGSGCAGLSAALELAKNNIKVILISEMPSERSQSVMAEGGINAVLNTKNDSPELHAEETLKAGRYIANPSAVKNMTSSASKIIENLFNAGMSFTLNSDKKPDVRPFGGQTVARTTYAAANTGKQLMHTLIDQTRKYEANGTIERLTNWLFLKLVHSNNCVHGCLLCHKYSNELKFIPTNSIITATGGLNGLFGNATGIITNTGYVTASLFADGVSFANGEFIQYHPTTVKLHKKHMLITEAVRGEGGRLYIIKDNKPYYFMEEKYPELGNLMPRDIISREEWNLIQKGYKIFLDMSHLSSKAFKKLHGVIDDCKQFLSINPTKEPIPVTPAIHYFMGGIKVDLHHRTDIKGLYAAGECACQYHGANRLGGNSLLGALYGGKVAANSAIEDLTAFNISFDVNNLYNKPTSKKQISYIDMMNKLNLCLQNSLGIIRTEETLQKGLKELQCMYEIISNGYDYNASIIDNLLLKNGCLLSQAMLMSALNRKESRGAHFRSDFPNENENYKYTSVAKYTNDKINVYFETPDGGIVN